LVLKEMEVDGGLSMARAVHGAWPGMPMIYRAG